jgi:outer membrane protein assembly factor BamB
VAAGGRASPAVSGGTVFLGDSDGGVYAFAADTGETVWRADMGSRVATQLVVANGTVYVGTAGSGVIAVATSTGEERWRFSTDGITTGMAADDVAELTELFEAVRYGTAVPTEARETRAIAALRRIEDAYAGDAT